MPSDNEVLASLYKQIAVLEMIEKLKGCGLIWNQISNYQFQAIVEQSADVWEIYLTKISAGSSVIMDFSKNGSFFYSLNSDDEPNIVNMFDEISTDEDYEKDKEIMRDIQQTEVCG